MGRFIKKAELFVDNYRTNRLNDSNHGYWITVLVYSIMIIINFVAVFSVLKKKKVGFN